MIKPHIKKVDNQWGCGLRYVGWCHIADTPLAAYKAWVKECGDFYNNQFPVALKK